ncbi:hypothetical protein [Catenisphaera adipataccumulans]|uniref:Uncharacterized protein n=1 Tax=Catenisphaera adipataccumulans TaxID=700500 RepID=A0A7W8FVF8_9FIRM|nr:hypothetical protein [Catenisphaera adipataccumulans]MBB5183579.1 hypothetical protein [Catenisphaera adipataccumulans]
MIVLHLPPRPVQATAADAKKDDEPVFATINGEPAASTIYCPEPMTVSLHLADADLKDYTVYLDGVKQDALDIPITPEHQTITIVMRHQSGIVTTQEIRIHSISLGEPDIDIPEYVFDRPVTLKWSKLPELTPQVQIDQTTLKDAAGVYSYQPDKTGTYTVHVSYPQAPYLKSSSYTFHYTNQLPSVSLQASALASNQDVTVHCTSDAPWIKTSYLEVDGQLQPWTSELVLKAADGEDHTYHVRAVVTDVFDHTAAQDIDVQIRRIPPHLSILFNGDMMPSDMTFTEVRSLQFQTTEPVQLEGSLNGMPVSILDLTQQLQQMDPGDILQVRCTVQDRFGNINTSVYTWIKASLLPTPDESLLRRKEKKPVTKKVQTKTKITGDAVQIRTWTLDDQNHLHVRQEIHQPQKKSQIIFMVPKHLHKGSKIRIVWLDPDGKTPRFFAINHKKIKTKWKTDRIGNRYYEFKLKKKTVVKLQTEDQTVRRVFRIEKMAGRPKWQEIIQLVLKALHA